MSASTKPLALIGMMGAGKSSVAQQLAELADCRWYDLDAVVSEHNGSSVPDLFACQGEAQFRRLETESLRWILTTQPGRWVLATGGGAPITPENQKLLKPQCCVVWLDGDPEILYRRAAGPSRPLAQDGPAAFVQRARERRAVYREMADYAVDVSDRSISEIADLVWKWWEQREQERTS